MKTETRSALALPAALLALVPSLLIAAWSHMALLRDSHRETAALSATLLKTFARGFVHSAGTPAEFRAILTEGSLFLFWDSKGNILSHSDAKIEAEINKRRAEKDYNDAVLKFIEDEIGSIKANKKLLRKGAFLDVDKEGHRYYMYLSYGKPQGKLIKRIISLYVLAAIFSLIVYIIVWFVAGRVTRQIGELTYDIQTGDIRSSERFAELNLLASRLFEKLRGNEETRTSEKLPGIETLYRRPVQRIRTFDISFYPSRPKGKKHDCLAASETDASLDAFFLRFGMRVPEDILLENRYQERFFSFSEARQKPAMIAHSFTEDLLQYPGKEPSLLYFRWDSEDSTLKLLRSGGYLIHKIHSSGVEEIESGSLVFSSNAEAETVPLSLQDYVVVTSTDLPESIGLSLDEYRKIISHIPAENRASNTLRSLLRALYDAAPTKEAYPSGALFIAGTKS